MDINVMTRKQFEELDCFKGTEEFDVDRDFFKFKTSPEILNRIKQKTLLNIKSVWDLFKEKDIYIN